MSFLRAPSVVWGLVASLMFVVLATSLPAAAWCTP